MIETNLFINGQWRPALDKEWFEVISPINGQVIGKAPLSREADVEEALESANSAQVAWGRTDHFYRSKLLRQASQAVLNAVEEIAQVMTEEQGKTLTESRQEVKKGADILRYYAEEIERVSGRIIPNEQGTCMSAVIYQPIGVSCSITSWNYPIELIAWKVGAALAAGCVIICKLPTWTPLSPTLFLRKIIDVGLPAGVLQILTGHGHDVGRFLVADPRVKKIAFTGSTRVGKIIASLSAPTLKKLTLELGGNLPLIICKDARLDEAVNGCVRRSFRNCGQICIAVNRVFVDEVIYDQFLDLLTQRTLALRIGNPKMKGVDLGPVCHQQILDTVKEHVEDALHKGARVLTGGRRPEERNLQEGYYYEPTLLADVSPDMLIMSEEVFGPAIGLSSFADLDEAIALANDSRYGLAAIAYTNCIQNIHRLSTELEVGNIAFNNADAGVLNAPYGGWKESGLGYEHGPEGLHEYLRAKHLRLQFDEK